MVMEHARNEANGLGNLRFEVASAQQYPGNGYDLVTIFVALHDMGDPVGAVAHAHKTLKSDGRDDLLCPVAHRGATSTAV
jgi:hypothetical protein